MKFLYVLIPIIMLPFFECNQIQSNANDANALLQTDRDFNIYCTQHGINVAFLQYADSSAIQSRQGAFPLKGIEEIKKAQKNDSGKKLTWEPEKGEVSGNIGYTFGWWKYYAKGASGKDTIYQGDYVNVWKKQKGGSWKYLIDIGNDTPAYSGK